MSAEPIRSVVMTVDAVGGIWTYALDLARALAAGGTAVTFAVVGPPLDAGRRQAAADAGIDLADLGASPEWLAAKPAEVARGAEALARLAREAAADLIHLNHPAFGADILYGRPVVAVCHSCVATWWAAVKGTPLPEDLAWQAGLLARAYQAATLLVAPTAAFAEATQRAYRLPAAPVVVPNGRAAPPMGLPAPSSPSATGLTAGRLWDEGKDLAVLDTVAGLSPAPFRAAGPVTGPNGTTAHFTHLQALGTLDEAALRARLAERPVYLSAARYEPFGLSVLEAAQAGCALILSDIPTYRELWGEAADFVPPGDAPGFAAALDRLIGDAALQARQGEAARQRAGAFAIEACARRMRSLYAEAAARQRTVA